MQHVDTLLTKGTNEFIKSDALKYSKSYNTGLSLIKNINNRIWVSMTLNKHKISL